MSSSSILKCTCCLLTKIIASHFNAVPCRGELFRENLIKIRSKNIFSLWYSYPIGKGLTSGCITCNEIDDSSKLCGGNVKDALNNMRQAPTICPICNEAVIQHPTGRILCSSSTCDFEWHWKPLVQLLRMPVVNERLNRPGLTNTEIACYMLGWQGGTVHQVAARLGVCDESVLNAKDIRGLLNAVAE